MIETGVKEKFALSGIKDDPKRPRRRRWRALDYRVLVVASEGYAGDWTAYIGAVPGDNHDKEWEEVLEHGSKLPREVAEVLFSDFASNLEWRD